MLKRLFFLLIVRPLVLLVMGIHVSGRERLPAAGPCIVAANHNSHLDALVLLCLFPLARLGDVRPVAAADYFFKTRLRAWFAKRVIGIIPLRRHPGPGGGDPLAGVRSALEAKQTVIFFPEGSRGEPERMAPFKRGVAHLAKAFPEVPVVPVFIRGAGKSLPRNEALLVPFIIDVAIGEPLYYRYGGCAAFTEALETRIRTLNPTQGECYE